MEQEAECPRETISATGAAEKSYEHGSGRGTGSGACDGDGKLDVIIEIRGLNNYIYSLRGSDGQVLWRYGNKNLLLNPALNEKHCPFHIPGNDPAEHSFGYGACL